MRTILHEVPFWGTYVSEHVAAPRRTRMVFGYIITPDLWECINHYINLLDSQPIEFLEARYAVPVEQARLYDSADRPEMYAPHPSTSFEDPLEYYGSQCWEEPSKECLEDHPYHIYSASMSLSRGYIAFAFSAHKELEHNHNAVGISFDDIKRSIER